MRTSGAILVAQANHAVADMIAEILRDEGFTVHTQLGKDAAYDNPIDQRIW